MGNIPSMFKYSFRLELYLCVIIYETMGFSANGRSSPGNRFSLTEDLKVAACRIPSRLASRVGDNFHPFPGDKELQSKVKTVEPESETRHGINELNLAAASRVAQKGKSTRKVKHRLAASYGAGRPTICGARTDLVRGPRAKFDN